MAVPRTRSQQVARGRGLGRGSGRGRAVPAQSAECARPPHYDHGTPRAGWGCRLWKTAGAYGFVEGECPLCAWFFLHEIDPLWPQ